MISDFLRQRWRGNWMDQVHAGPDHGDDKKLLPDSGIEGWDRLPMMCWLGRLVAEQGYEVKLPAAIGLRSGGFFDRSRFAVQAGTLDDGDAHDAAWGHLGLIFYVGLVWSLILQWLLILGFCCRGLSRDLFTVANRHGLADRHYGMRQKGMWKKSRSFRLWDAVAFGIGWPALHATDSLARDRLQAAAWDACAHHA